MIPKFPIFVFVIVVLQRQVYRLKCLTVLRPMSSLIQKLKAKNANGNNIKIKNKNLIKMKNCKSKNMRMKMIKLQLELIIKFKNHKKTICSKIT